MVCRSSTAICGLNIEYPTIETCLACHLFYTNRFVRNDITELRNHHSCYRWQEQIPLIIHSDFSVSVTYICAKLVIKLQTHKPQFKSTFPTCAKFIVT